MSSPSARLVVWRKSFIMFPHEPAATVTSQGQCPWQHGKSPPLPGGRELALALNQRLMPLHQALFVESNSIPANRARVRSGWIANADPRLPPTPLSIDGQRRWSRGRSERS